MSSLAGKKILITRAANQSAALISMLASKGATALCFPCIEIKFLPVPEIHWNEFDSVVFTSSNGQKSFTDIPIPPHIKICTYKDRLKPTGRVLLVQGNLANSTLETQLQSQGHPVTRINTYQTRIGTGGINLKEHLLDAIIFTSPSTAENFLKRGGKQSNESIVCIGTTTYKAVCRLGFQNVVYSPKPTLDGLISVLEMLLNE